MCHLQRAPTADCACVLHSTTVILCLHAQAWLPRVKALRALSQKWNLPVLVTEMGYQVIADWSLLRTSDGGLVFSCVRTSADL